ncbi:gelsolin-related protein of 125 kDa-like [Trifolium pratense]|uniref:gelsolin-related protein of 125 kDa-like n=1 Tax=Trifolium pratense TaxID=57577 RepID=UPI001E6966C0|nr:gelsolin-related protein of 125 kDa-like [Trifolium pratense]
MGCGKSKLDVVASGNTIPQIKKSSSRVDASKAGHQNGTETKSIANNNVDNDVSKLEQKGDENVKPNVVVAPDEITNVQQQDNALETKKNQEEVDVAENKTQEIVVAEEKDVSLENTNQPEAAKEDKLPENVKEETLVKEVEEETNKEETLVKEEKEEETKETNEEANLTKEEEVKETSQEEIKEAAKEEEIKEAAKDEETKEAVQEEIVVVANEEKNNETNVSTSEGGEEKDVKADEQGQ